MFLLHPKRKLLTRFTASAILALGILAGSSGMSPASADIVRPYLGWSESGGYCYGTWSKYVGTRTYDPKTHSVTRLKSTETTSSSMTKIYNQNGVSQARVYESCQHGGLTRNFNPSVYKHRTIKVHYVCYSGRCRITSSIYGSWLSGTGTPM